MKNVLIFDTTLRDGEQALQRALSRREKIVIAKQLAKLNVDVIEAGFPISSPEDFKSVETIAKEIQGPIICGLSRAVEKDIDACASALKHAKRPRIHTFLATSDIHMEKKFRKTQEQVVEMAVQAVTYARRFCDDVEFSCEDAGRTSLELLYHIVESVIKAGATTVNIPDTVGYTVPSEFGTIIKNVFNNVPNIDKTVVSVHCHNDLGLAVSNSLAAVQAGARQVECTMNGLGERAGNAALEEIVMILGTRQKLLNLSTNIKTQELYPSSKLVSRICNVSVQQNKAVIGKNAFSHSSGIHQDGVLKEKSTYEIMSPQTIGREDKTFNLTGRSGRHVIKHRLEKLGYAPGYYDLDKIYDSFLALADKKGQVFDDDLELLMEADAFSSEDTFNLCHLQVSSGLNIIPNAALKIDRNGNVIQESATGDGPVDACFNAIDRACGISAKIEEYTIVANPGGRMAVGTVNLIADYNGRKIHGVGFSTDIIEASAHAYLNAINKIERLIEIDKFKNGNNEG
ncbi:MAG: 2-isopropylmalate synthase [Bacteriovoracaceae bacterium]|nr:2-isopropylmalate synthase [Bacteriovoracaceae bacterium]